jgi:hypothetical protein
LPEEAALDWTTFQIVILGTENDNAENGDKHEAAWGLSDLTSWLSEFRSGAGRIGNELSNEKAVNAYVEGAARATSKV